MKRYNRISVILGMFLFFIVMGSNILVSEKLTTQLLFLIFVIFEIIIIFLSLRKRIDENLIMLFTKVYWYMYMTMAILYILYNDYFDENKYLWLILILIISIICICIGEFFANKIVRVSNKFFILPVKEKLYLMLFVMAVLVNIYTIYSNGGLYSFINSGYELKYSNDAKLYSIIDKLFLTPFMYFNLAYVVGNNKKVITWIARFYYVYQLIYIYISGSSLRILMMFISLCIMGIFGYEKKIDNKTLSNKQKKWIVYGIVLSVIGVVFAILIRFNRGSNEFSFDVLSNAYTLIFTTSTFDSLYYFVTVCSVLNPNYSMGQFLFPFVFYIPRNIFIYKPIELGRIIATTFMNFNENINGGFAGTSMGEFFYDFGYLGIIIGMIFIGFMFTAFQRRYNFNKGNRKIRLACMLALMIQSASICTSWTTMGSYVLGIIVFFHLVNFINRIIYYKYK